MTDINKQMEKKAHSWAMIGNNISDYNTLFYSFKKGYESALHDSRWRKVSEELPKIKEENYFINVKRKDNPIRVETLCIFAVWVSVKEYLDFYEVVEWKPIDL